MKIFIVAGARPNFMKIAPIIREIKNVKKTRVNLDYLLIHTGQHYDQKMSDAFFKDLNIPEPDIDLGVGSGAHGEQTARIMAEFERVCLGNRPDLVVVVGDVNSTIACALVAVKLHIPVAHVEAGLRSFDRTMPEEINRVLTDQISDYLFTTCEEDAEKNLLREGVDKKKIFFVGNVMIDTLIRLKGKAGDSQILSKLNLRKGNYAVCTLHRPSNVDHKKTMNNIVKALHTISEKLSIIFPIHPRTLKQMKEFQLTIESKNIQLIEPLGYIDFLNLYMNSKFVITDSGGIQEETTYLGIPCLTLRENTERPITVTEGTNIMIGRDMEKLIKESLKIINGDKKLGKVPKFWDGKAASRIVRILVNEK